MDEEIRSTSKVTAEIILLGLAMIDRNTGKHDFGAQIAGHCAKQT